MVGAAGGTLLNRASAQCGHKRNKAAKTTEISATMQAPLITRSAGLCRPRGFFGIFAVGVQAHCGLRRLPVQFRAAPLCPRITVQSFSTISDGLSVPSA